MALFDCPLRCGLLPLKNCCTFNGGYSFNFTVSRYVVVTERKTWNDSKHNCEEMGGRLMEIHTQEAFIKAQRFYREIRSSYWLGANDAQTEGTWVWNSNQDRLQRKELWGDGRPYNSTRLNCLAMSSQLLDGKCNAPTLSVCEFIDIDLF